MPFGNCFRNRSVFVTGHTGFKGAWLSLWLTELGARVHGYALEPPTRPSLFDEADVRSRLASHTIADVRDWETLAKAIRLAKPEFVFHLAAQAIVRYGYREPRQTYETNVMGTVNLLDAVRAADSVRVCQIITSDKCYENREWIYPYREDEPMGGADPYSSSKGCAELVVSAYRRSFFDPARVERHGVSLASVRAGNVIGGGDWAEDRIIPDCIRALSKNEVIPVRNPSAIRPWQHVLEPLSGYLQLAAAQYTEPARFSQAWNFGPTGVGHLSVRQVVDEVIRHWGSGSWQGGSAPERTNARGGSFHEATFLKLDINKATDLLQWRPLWAGHEAIAQTVLWYRDRAFAGQDFNASRYCVGQIEAYTKQASEQGLVWAQSDGT
jgi:CDP-glucose 4,6-dehydratase